MNGSKKLRVAIGAALLTAAATLPAAPVVDGKFDGIGTGGYSTGWAVNFGDAYGELWTFEDTTSAYFALVLPTDLKDNTYGAGTYQNFESLSGSDKLVLRFQDSTGTSSHAEVRLDYLEGSPNDDPGSTFTSAFTGADGSVNPPPAGFAGATSMEYNCNSVAGGSAYCGKGLSSPTPGSLSGWIYEVVYEFKVPQSAFGAGGFSDPTQLVLYDIHLSPKKAGTWDQSSPPLGDEVCTDTNPTSPVYDCMTTGGGPPPPSGDTGTAPEPSTLGLLLAGMGLVALGRSRRRGGKDEGRDDGEAS